MSFEIRGIRTSDNSAIKHIIKQVLIEFGANKPGFAWDDPELDSMAETYSKEAAVYLIAEVDNKIVGGAGIGPFDCEYPATCELQKMYFLPTARGKGIGKVMIDTLLNKATELGYKYCYLETLEHMTNAVSLYESSGFTKLNKPLGDSGHSGCNNWYLRKLEAKT